MILYSEVIIRELRKDYSFSQIREIFDIAQKNDALQQIIVNDEHLKEMNDLSRELKLPRADCLHAILARDNDACMITRDRHFGELQKIAKIRAPEELI